ncbi:MAG: hypothetical protein F4W92_00780 [Gammaproteobacteria bacterium]|nr:hypothetical protein [Gammaproteobacteria bacterium]
MNSNIETSHLIKNGFKNQHEREQITDRGVLDRIRPGHQRILKFSRVSMFVGTVLVLIMLMLDLYFVGLLVAALMCGMAESHGRCGISHIGMLAPLKALNSSAWVKCCLAYTLGGVVTAYLIGLSIAGLGSWIKLGMSPYYLGLIGSVCVLFLIRDVGWLRFKPPQCDQQTYKEWAMMFGRVVGAGMWGAHIGLAVTTVIKYGGLYCLVLVAFGFGIGMGEWLLVAFWLGRVVFLWATPSLMSSSPDGMKIGITLEHSDSAFRLCSLSGLTCILVLNLVPLFPGLL